MSEEMTELDLLVGSMFTTRPEEDRDLYEDEKEWLSDVQDQLREEGVEVDLLSKPGVEVWEGGIRRFMDLYQLRLLAAYIEQGRDISSVMDVEADPNDEPDALLAAIWEGETTTRFPHLINHQADGGYYIPADFAEPIWMEFELDEDADEDEESEGQVVSFGSSTALQRELVELDTLLNDNNVPSSHPSVRCLNVLREAASQSVSNDLPIVIW